MWIRNSHGTGACCHHPGEEDHQRADAAFRDWDED
jgi:hypothetical protein